MATAWSRILVTTLDLQVKNVAPETARFREVSRRENRARHFFPNLQDARVRFAGRERKTFSTHAGGRRFDRRSRCVAHDAACVGRVSMN